MYGSDLLATAMRPSQILTYSLPFHYSVDDVEIIEVLYLECLKSQSLPNLVNSDKLFWGLLSEMSTSYISGIPWGLKWIFSLSMSQPKNLLTPLHFVNLKEQWVIILSSNWNIKLCPNFPPRPQGNLMWNKALLSALAGKSCKYHISWWSLSIWHSCEANKKTSL